MTVPALIQYRPCINNNLPNYQDEVLHLTTGCSVEVTGKIVESPGQGQNFEIHATKVVVVGMVDDPETYPMAAKRHSVGICVKLLIFVHAQT